MLVSVVVQNVLALCIGNYPNRNYTMTPLGAIDFGDAIPASRPGLK